MSTKTVSRGITRFDVGKRGGYMVRIARRGERISRYFSDTTWGGKRKALAAAKQAYADLLEELGPAENATRDRLTSRNTSGVVGVHLAYTLDKRYSGAEYYAYCASWVTEDGKREKASFAWKKYGEDRALQLAIIARQRQITDHDEILAIYQRSGAAKGSGAAKAGKRKAKGAQRKASKATTKKNSVQQHAKRAATKTEPNAGRRTIKKTSNKTIKKTAKRSVKNSVKNSAKATVSKPAAQQKAPVKKKTLKKKSVRRASTKKATVKTSRSSPRTEAGGASPRLGVKKKAATKKAAAKKAAKKRPAVRR